MVKLRIAIAELQEVTKASAGKEGNFRMTKRRR
jgi:hypothetical protein